MIAIKQLEWSEIEQDRGDGHTDTTGEWEASSIVGVYAINISTCGDMHAPWEVFGGDDSKIGNFETLDEAKAAAQADYEARILSALAHPLHQPAPEAGPATVTGIIKDAIVETAARPPGRRGPYTFDEAELQAQAASLAAPAPEPQAPVPDGVTEEMVEAAARAMAEVISKRHGHNDSRGWLNEQRREEARAALTAAPALAPVPDGVTEALRPFAEAVGPEKDYPDDSNRPDAWEIWEMPEAMNITLGDLRRARNALAALTAANERSR